MRGGRRRAYRGRGGVGCSEDEDEPMSVCVVAEYPWKAVRPLIGPEPPPIEPTPEMLENIAKSVGHPVDFGSRFPIHSAMAGVVSAFTEAIEDVASPTVALPVHPIIITKEGYTVPQAVL